MSRATSFCGVILAAGESSRMGRDKALLPWPPPGAGRAAAAVSSSYLPDRSVIAELEATPTSGETFLSATIELLREHTQLVLIVAGANAEILSAVAYARGASVVVNRKPELGQFSSLQTGLREVLNRGRDAALIALVDRPPASNATVRRLLAAFDEVSGKGKWAVVPEYAGRHGHPILLGREMMEAFLKAPPTSTARDVEHSLQARIEYVPVDDPLVTVNINTPEDYETLAAGLRGQASG